MDTRKTRTDERSSYTYEFDGTKETIRPGEREVTEEHIKVLYAFDDSEVYYNNKNGHPPVEDWMKPLIKEWEANNPGEKWFKNWNLSLEAAAESVDGHQDKAHALFEAFEATVSECDFFTSEETQFLVENYLPEYWKLYYLYFIYGMSCEELRKLYDCSWNTMHKHIFDMAKKVFEEFH